MLRELGDEGRIEQRRKKLHRPGALPPVVARRHHRPRSRRRTDRRPDRMGRGGRTARRRKSASIPHAGRGPAKSAGIGDRALLRVEETGEDADADPPFGPRHQDHRSGQASCARHLPRAAGRRRPAGADRQEAARPRACDSRRCDRRRRGWRTGRGRSRHAPASACRRRGSRNGSARSRASAPSA